MDTIHNPKTNKFINLKTKTGVGVLRKYVENLSNNTEYNTIIHPITNKKLKTNGKKGVELLEEYTQTGGSNTDNYLYDIIEDAYKSIGMKKNKVSEEFCKIENNHIDKNIFLLDMHGSEEKYKKYIKLRPCDSVILSCIPSHSCSTYTTKYGKSIGIKFLKRFKKICRRSSLILKNSSSFCMYKNWCPNLNFKLKVNSRLPFQGLYKAYNFSEWENYDSTNKLIYRVENMSRLEYINLEKVIQNLQETEPSGFTLFVITCRNFRPMHITNMNEIFIMNYINENPHKVNDVLTSLNSSYINLFINILEVYYYIHITHKLISKDKLKTYFSIESDVNLVDICINNILDNNIEFYIIQHNLDIITHKMTSIIIITPLNKYNKNIRRMAKFTKNAVDKIHVTINELETEYV